MPRAFLIKKKCFNGTKDDITSGINYTNDGLQFPKTKKRKSYEAMALKQQIDATTVTKIQSDCDSGCESRCSSVSSRSPSPPSTWKFPHESSSFIYNEVGHHFSPLASDPATAGEWMRTFINPYLPVNPYHLLPTKVPHQQFPHYSNPYPAVEKPPCPSPSPSVCSSSNKSSCFSEDSQDAAAAVTLKRGGSEETARYQCPDCHKSYSTFSGLSKHQQFHCATTNKRTFSCKYCDKVYMSLGAVKMHIRTHTLPCKCDLCGKAFSRPWLLQGHMRTHTGEKPFSCTQCNRAFADRSNLRAHLQTHSDVKKYSCKKCLKTFSRMSLLLKHEDGNNCTSAS